MDYHDLYQGPDKCYYCSSFQYCTGFTLLMRLCCNEVRQIPFQEIESYLKNHPDEINRQNQLGWTVLMLIFGNYVRTQYKYKYKYKLVELLMQYGANTHLLNNYNEDALFLAVTNYYDRPDLEIIQLLLDHGVNNKYGSQKDITILKIAQSDHHKWNLYRRPIIKLLRKKKLHQLILKNQLLKEKNKILKQNLEHCTEGHYIWELFKSFKNKNKN